MWVPAATFPRHRLHPSTTSATSMSSARSAMTAASCSRSIRLPMVRNLPVVLHTHDDDGRWPSVPTPNHQDVDLSQDVCGQTQNHLPCATEKWRRCCNAWTPTHYRQGDVECITAMEKRLRVRFHIIRNGRIENVGKYQSCMFFKLRIIWKQTVLLYDQQRDEILWQCVDH